MLLWGNEKWILYTNVEWKKSLGKWNEPPPTTPKSSLHPEKLMLCILWEWKGVLYYELLPENQTVNSSEYFSQLYQLKAALDWKVLWYCESASHSVMSDSLRPHGYTVHGILQARKLEWVAFPFFPTQWSNPGLPHCRQVLYQLSHQGNPRILRVGSLSLLSGSSWPRNWNGVSCTADGFFTSWATREAHNISDIVDPCNTWMEWVFRGGGKRTGSWTHVEVESDFLLCLSVG